MRTAEALDAQALSILLVVDGMHPKSGGPPAVVVGSAVALAKRGHRVVILSTAAPGDEAVVRDTWSVLSESNIRLVFCAEEGARGLLLGSPQRALFEGLVREADVIHLHGIWRPAMLIVGRLAHKLGTPYFASVHGIFDRRAMKRVKHKFLKKRLAMHLFRIYDFLDQAAGVVFGSEAEAAQSWMPSSRMRVIFIPNGAPGSLGQAEPTPSELARLHAAAPKVKTWRRTLLCRSRIHPEKGIDLLVAAFGEVARTYPDSGLLIAGMRQDEAYERRIAGMIAKNPAGDRLQMTTELTGPSSQFLYRACDAFLMPSIAEGFSMALIEGLASGRPLLITKYCHMPIVMEAGAGLVVDPTAPAIAEGLHRLLKQDDAAWAEMGLNARRLFVENYTWDHVAEQLDAEYARAAEGRRP